MDNSNQLSSAELLQFDGDGTLYIDGHALEGASELIAYCNDRKLAYTLVTNNSRRTGEDCALYNRKHTGIPFNPEWAISTIDSTAAYLNSMRGYFSSSLRVLVLGPDALKKAIQEKDIDTVSAKDFANACWQQGSEPHAVVVGAKVCDTDTTEYLAPAISAILDHRAKLIGTNTDKLGVRKGVGRVPGTGFWVSGLADTVGVKPIDMGKPETVMYRMGLELHGVSGSESVMVGDNPQTDIGVLKTWKDEEGSCTGGCLVGTGVPKKVPELYRAHQLGACMVDSCQEILDLLRKH